MWSNYVILSWISALIFTLISLHRPRMFYLGIIAGIFWISTAYGMVQVWFVGFGSQNVITYSHELGDWYGEQYLFYLVASVGLILMIQTFANMLIASRTDVIDAWEGRKDGLDTLPGSRR